MSEKMQFELVQIASLIVLYAAAILTAMICCSVPLLTGGNGTEPRHTNLDGLRALAAVGVAACHVNQSVCGVLGFKSVPHLGDHVGIASVQIFFALTAFLFTEKAMSGKVQVVPFFVGRAKRILPLYMFVTAIALCLALYYTRRVSWPLQQIQAEVMQVIAFGFWAHMPLTLKGFNMLTLVGVAWSLSYEWAFYLLLVPLSKVWEASRTALGLVLVVILMGAAYHYSRQPESVIWPFFIPGVVAALAYRFLPHPPETLAGRLPYASMTVLILMVALPGYWTWPKLMLSLLLFLSVLYSRSALLSSKPLQFLATVSFSIYLMQYLVLHPIALFIWKHSNLLPAPYHRAAAFSVVMVVLVLCSVITYTLVERPFIGRRRATKFPVRGGAVHVPLKREFVSSTKGS